MAEKVTVTQPWGMPAKRWPFFPNRAHVAVFVSFPPAVELEITTDPPTLNLPSMTNSCFLLAFVVLLSNISTLLWAMDQTFISKSASVCSWRQPLAGPWGWASLLALCVFSSRMLNLESSPRPPLSFRDPPKSSMARKGGHLWGFGHLGLYLLLFSLNSFRVSPAWCLLLARSDRKK